MSKARHVRQAVRGGTHTRRVSKAGRLALAIAMGGIGLLVFPGAQQAGAAGTDGAVTVRVVREINANGVWDHTAPVVEPGIAGATVRLTDPDGHTLTGQTDTQGTVVLDPAASSLVGGRYRVEVDNPDPTVFSPSFAAEGAASGTPLAPSLDVVDVTGGRPAEVTTGFWNPADYTQADPRIVSAHQRDAVFGIGGGSVYTDSYTVNATAGQVDEATQAQTGTVFGLGWNRAAGLAYAGAFAKRGAPYGPDGPGALYWIDPATNAVGTFAVVPNAGSTVHHTALAAPDNHDLAFVGAPGKEALGDVEVSEDGTRLYAVNLADRKVYVYTISADGRSGALARVLTPPATACTLAGDWRPGALGKRDGAVYVGGVCSGENGGQASLRSVVWRYDATDLAAAPTRVLDQPMAYGRGSTFPFPCPSPADPFDAGTWHAWTDTTPACATDLNAFYPMPELMGIDFEITGEMLLSYRDRFGDQYGTTTLSTQQDRFIQPAAEGDLLRACPDASGQFVLDENGGCGDLGAAGEYYDDDSAVAAFHQESAFSGIAIAYNQATIVSNAVDVTATFELDTANMARSGTGGQLGTGWTSSEVQAPSGFLKGNGLADIEVMAEQAPVQIGNRLWYDGDGDGIQDGDEDGVPAGVHLSLYDADGAKVAATTTDGRGQYYFDSLTDGVRYGADYTVRVDDPSDFVPGGPLDATAWTLTTQDAGSGSAADQTDSDAAVQGGFPRIAVTVGGPGADDHRYDAGFVPSDPGIDIVDVDGRADVPADAVDGPDPVGGPQTQTSQNWPDAVDADTEASAVRYDVDAAGSTGAQPVRFVVTNTGNVALARIEVDDETLEGADLTGIACDFPGVSGTANGTTWSGPMAPGTSFACLGTVELQAGEKHGNTARVTAVPAADPDGPQVGDEDQFHAVAAQPPAPVLEPAVDIVDVDGRAAVPANAVDGADPVGGGQEITPENWPAGVDADTPADQVTYQVGPDGSSGPQPVRFVVTNTGTAPLGDVEVTQETLAGPDLTDVQCDFPGVSGTANGTTWAGPMAVGDSFACVGTVTLQAGDEHGDRAQVTAVGLDADGTPASDPVGVDDEDRFHATAVAPEPVLVPAVDIVDVDGRAEVPANPVDGPDPIGGGETATDLNWTAGVDADTADNAVGYTVDGSGTSGPQPVRFVVTNTGTAPLGDVEVTQETLAGPDLTGVTCDFPGMAGTENGTTWAGPMAVGDSFTCRGLVTVPAGQDHADRAQVTAVELDSRGNPVTDPRTVGDEDQFHAFAVAPAPTTSPAIDIVDVDGRADGPVDPVDGPDPVGGPQATTDQGWEADADADTAGHAATYEVIAPATSGPQLVRFVVTNTGTTPLGSIEVTQQTLDGPDLQGLQCAFPMPAQPGTRWDGPLAVGGSFECTATVTLAAGQEHGDLARVRAVELGADGEPVADPRTVDDEDQFHAATVQPGLRITKRDAQTGAEADGAADPVVLDPGESRRIAMPVTNSGDVALHTVRVSDRTVAGVAMTGFECRFPGEDTWTAAVDGTVTWAASVPGSGSTQTWPAGVTFGCRGTLTLQAGSGDHASVVRVTATSPAGNPLADENPFHAVVAVAPAVDIVAYDGRFPTPENPVDGHDPVNGVFQGPTAGDWDPAVDADTTRHPARYPATAEPRTVRMVVTNTGTSVLDAVAVHSRTTIGSPVADLSCDFAQADPDAPRTGTTWTGRFAPGESFFCTGRLGLAPGAVHADTAWVTARSTPGGRTVSDEDQFRAVAADVVTAGPRDGELPNAGGPTAWLVGLGAVLLAAGVALTRWRVSSGRHRG